MSDLINIFPNVIPRYPQNDFVEALANFDERRIGEYKESIHPLARSWFALGDKYTATIDQIELIENYWINLMGTLLERNNLGTVRTYQVPFFSGNQPGHVAVQIGTTFTIEEFLHESGIRDFPYLYENGVFRSLGGLREVKIEERGKIKETALNTNDLPDVTFPCVGIRIALAENTPLTTVDLLKHEGFFQLEAAILSGCFLNKTVLQRIIYNRLTHKHDDGSRVSPYVKTLQLFDRMMLGLTHSEKRKT